MDYEVYLWLAAVVVFTIIEALAVQMISIWLAGAALIALVFSLLGAPMWTQIAAFVICAFLLLCFTRPIVRRFMKGSPARTNADRALGMTAVVVREINNEEATGQVRVNGQIWTARSMSGSVMQIGEKVVVRSIEGVKLIVSEPDEEVAVPEEISAEPEEVSFVPEEELNESNETVSAVNEEEA